MSAQSAFLVAELKRLRRGRGVHALDLGPLVGPGLRALCGVADRDDTSTVRRKVATTLGGLAETLPEDLRLALLASLALHPDTRQPLLKQRLEWLAVRMARDLRTARRRSDEACARLAEAAVDPAGDAAIGSGNGWYVRTFSALVRLDAPAPEVIEHREIVATRDGVEEIIRSISAARHPGDRRPLHDLNASVLYGGRLARREHPSESHFRFAIALPRTLRKGQAHDFGLLVRLPPGQPMRTHYVFIPLRRCDRFDLRVRFDLARPPRTLWRVVGQPIRVVDDGQPSGDLLSVDAAGEIHAEFGDLAQGLCYGFQWSFR